MGIERCDKCGQEHIEVWDDGDEIADYRCPQNGRTEKITGRKPLDEALRVIRHEVINMEQDRQMRKEVLSVYKEQVKDVETTLAAVRATAGEVLKVHAIIDAYLEKWHKKKVQNDKG
jgi:hypothetical protein